MTRRPSQIPEIFDFLSYLSHTFILKLCILYHGFGL